MAPPRQDAGIGVRDRARPGPGLGGQRARQREVTAPAIDHLRRVEGGGGGGREPRPPVLTDADDGEPGEPGSGESGAVMVRAAGEC
ncbi:hypothetical protein GCM10025880_38450 [Methylorubrum aminovorans]|nr:hypothetical protein GCM10025880_38450 [Methylorubrum aminovorans]